ncbi:hypothetical protein C8J57DRAFT_1240084 [Mycena rebaudengoi]|nr:hypothetical protein C8J57DRAFT_1240084 [Mycena rebaudengoi]
MRLPRASLTQRRMSEDERRAGLDEMADVGTMPGCRQGKVERGACQDEGKPSHAEAHAGAPGAHKPHHTPPCDALPADPRAARRITRGRVDAGRRHAAEGGSAPALLPPFPGFACVAFLLSKVRYGGAERGGKRIRNRAQGKKRRDRPRVKGAIAREREKRNHNNNKNKREENAKVGGIRRKENRRKTKKDNGRRRKLSGLKNADSPMTTPSHASQRCCSALLCFRHIKCGIFPARVHLRVCGVREVRGGRVEGGEEHKERVDRRGYGGVTQGIGGQDDGRVRRGGARGRGIRGGRDRACSKVGGVQRRDSAPPGRVRAELALSGQVGNDVLVVGGCRKPESVEPTSTPLSGGVWCSPFSRSEAMSNRTV